MRSVSLATALLACSTVTEAQPTVTFTRDVAPILFAHCVSCHRDREIGGFSLLTYRDARPRASAIARATRTRPTDPFGAFEQIGVWADPVLAAGAPDLTPDCRSIYVVRQTDGGNGIDVLRR